MERLDVARKRGVKILAEVVGYGNTSDAFHDTEPSGEGARRAMHIARNRAFGKNSLGPVYINPHATATKGDRIEMKVILEEYDDKDRRRIAGISGTKGATGHMLGATGAIEAIFCVQALMHQIMPPTLRLEYPIDEAQGLNLVPKEAQPAEIDFTQNNSFGFGGINTVTIYKRAV